MGPVLFSTLISDLEEEMKSHLSNLHVTSRCGSSWHAGGQCSATERGWWNGPWWTNPVTFHKDKCSFLPLGTGWGVTSWKTALVKGPAHSDTGVSTSGFTDGDKCQQHTRLGGQEHSQWIAITQCSSGHHFGYTPYSFGSPNTLSKLNLIPWKARKMRGLEHIRRGWEKWLYSAWASESSGDAQELHHQVIPKRLTRTHSLALYMGTWKEEQRKWSQSKMGEVLILHLQIKFTLKTLRNKNR